MGSEYAEKLKDPRWQKLRLKVFERANFKCECCGDSTETLHVHHLIYTPTEPWESPLADLECLCKNYHELREDFNKMGGGRTRAPTLLCFLFLRLACHIYKKLHVQPKPENLGREFARYWDYVGPIKNGEQGNADAIAAEKIPECPAIVSANYKP